MDNLHTTKMIDKNWRLFVKVIKIALIISAVIMMSGMLWALPTYSRHDEINYGLLFMRLGANIGVLFAGIWAIASIVLNKD